MDNNHANSPSHAPACSTAAPNETSTASPSPLMYESNLDTTKKFEIFDHLREYASTQLGRYGIILSLDSKGEKRGKFLCSCKSYGVNKNNGKCPFSINYNKDAKTDKFGFTSWKLLHNHPLRAPGESNLEGEEIIKYEKQLRDSEAVAIDIFSLSHLSTSDVGSALERVFPGRSFDKTLLARMKKKAVDNRLREVRQENNLKNSNDINLELAAQKSTIVELENMIEQQADENETLRAEIAYLKASKKQMVNKIRQCLPPPDDSEAIESSSSTKRSHEAGLNSGIPSFNKRPCPEST